MSIAIVTGCRGAIGRAICAELAAAGHRIVGLDRPGRPGGDPTPGATVFECDLADAAATQAALAAIRRLGPVGLLVNNAGHYAPKPFLELDLADFDLTMAVNVRAPFLLARAVAGWMVEDGTRGAIVNIASIAGKLGSPVVPYGTSKAALIGLTRSLAQSLAPHGIRVNAIAPGIVETPMSRAVDPAQMERQLAAVAMRRVGRPEEIARVVRFLADDASSYMTGSIVDVAGGWMS